MAENMTDFENLNTYLYRQIKEMIWNKQLPPGVKIKQVHLAGELGVSRTPLIKVLERLTSERLVEYIPRRGYYVKKLSLDEMIDIFSVRMVLEGVAVKEVIEKAGPEDIEGLAQYFAPFRGRWTREKKREYLKADQNFHDKLIELAGNDIIIDINGMFNVYRLSYQKGLMRDPAETLSEHLQIINRIKAKQGREAQLLIMDHIEKSRDNICRVYETRVGRSGEIDW